MKRYLVTLLLTIGLLLPTLDMAYAINPPQCPFEKYKVKVCIMKNGKPSWEEHTLYLCVVGRACKFGPKKLASKCAEELVEPGNRLNCHCPDPKAAKDANSGLRIPGMTDGGAAGITETSEECAPDVAQAPDGGQFVKYKNGWVALAPGETLATVCAVDTDSLLV